MHDILRYVESKMDPLLKRKINCVLELDEVGEPFIAFSYNLGFDDRELSLYNLSLKYEEDISMFASSITRFTRDSIKLKPLLEFLKPIVINPSDSYFKLEFSLDDSSGPIVRFSDDILLGFIIDPTKSKEMPFEDKMHLLNECIREMQNIHNKGPYTFKITKSEKLLGLENKVIK